ncbi:MAG: hypothetical protein ACLQOO_15485 [Terriglobia bacterium]
MKTGRARRGNMLEESQGRVQMAKGRRLPKPGERPVPSESSTDGLKRAYQIEDYREVAAFVEQNQLRRLLLEARGPLRDAFGPGAIKTLRLVRDGEGFETLFCLVMVSGEARKARRALRSFDEHWWLARLEQAGGKLNFDFELV